MASSTKFPIAKASANKVILLRVYPNSFITTNVGKIDNGNAIAVINVDRQFRKNKPTTITVKTDPKTNASTEA